MLGSPHTVLCAEETLYVSTHRVSSLERDAVLQPSTPCIHISSASHPLTSVVAPLRASVACAYPYAKDLILAHAIPAVERALGHVARRLADAVGHLRDLTAWRALHVHARGKEMGSRGGRKGKGTYYDRVAEE